MCLLNAILLLNSAVSFHPEINKFLVLICNYKCLKRCLFVYANLNGNYIV